MPVAQDGIAHINTSYFSDVSEPLNGPEEGISQRAAQKRKYHDVENNSNIWESFKIGQANQGSVTGSLIYKPRLVLPRSRLPLAYLDVNGNRDFGGGARPIFSRIPALESHCFDGDSELSPQILIAECNGKSLYAIERIQSGIYAQCRLGDWVALSELEERASDVSNTVQTKLLRSDTTGLWWQSMIADARGGKSPCRQQHAKNPPQPRIDLKRPDYGPMKPASSVKDISLDQKLGLQEDSTNGVEEKPLLELPQLGTEQNSVEPDDLLKSIRGQYMESLYRSKASLAYFAKGPLSRARAVFSDVNHTAASQYRLVEYLRSLIIPLGALDKKYREKLPALVAEFPTWILSGGEHLEAAPKLKKVTRKPKEEKIGKDGLYPQEQKDIQQWWLDRLVSIPVCEFAELRDEATKTILLEQRVRETHLQIILLLEVLALESTLPIPSTESALDEDHETRSPQKKRKPKKQQDVSMLLDLSVDKLCIWQSMAIEDNKSSKDSGGSEATQGADLPSKKPGTDCLRQFCIDVVLPFYLARLPEVSRVICKKLGGPLPLSPSRPALRKATSSLSRLQRPGTAVKRPQPREAKSTLERVLTDERTSRRPTPTLSRSATDSFLPNLKREPSDLPLANVPLNRSTFHKSNRYSQREVELNTVAQAAETKAKKKAKVEQELHGAIAALKRPNPRMAVKELVEAAEQRAAGAKSRKPKNPVRNPFAQSVQIMATPSANRRRNALNGNHVQSQQALLTHEELEEIPPSSCTHVPTSAIKVRTDEIMKSNSNTIKQRSIPAVEQTPSRRLAKFSQLDFAPHPASIEGNIQATPSSVMETSHTTIHGISPMPRCQKPLWIDGIQATPSRKASVGSHGNMLRVESEGTPTKQLKSVSVNISKAGENVVFSPASHEGGVSIYKNLGWDDDVGELL